MKNIINIKPIDDLHGRALYSTKFVDDYDYKYKDILDVGCGYGWFELNALKKDCHKISGIEISENDLKTAKDNINNGNVKFEIGSAIQLPFSDNIFDTVVSWEVIEHIPENTENQMFFEINRVLKKNGVFYISTPLNNLSKLFDPAWWLIGHRHYKAHDLIELAKNNNLVAEKINLTGGFWEIFGMYNLYIAKWIFRRTPFFENYFNKKQDSEYKNMSGFVNVFIKFRKK